MSNAVRGEALDWYEEALVDLEEARDALERGRPNWACFAAHQAVEKAFKVAYLLLPRRRYPKSHDLTQLYGELRAELALSPEAEEGLSILSGFYELARYPNAGLRRPSRGINRGVAERMVRLAQEVVALVGRRCGLKGA